MKQLLRGDSRMLFGSPDMSRAAPSAHFVGASPVSRGRKSIEQAANSFFPRLRGKQQRS